MSICKHNGCRRYLKLFNGPKRCEDCSPPLLHLILGRGRSHTPGNNDDTDVTDDNGNDGKNDSKRRTRSDVRAQQELDDVRAQQELDDVRAQQELDDIRAQQELDDMNRYCCSACANFPYESGNCYEKGWGVARDLNKAQELYTQAIGQGDVRAQQKLDDMMNRFYKPRGPFSGCSKKIFKQTYRCFLFTYNGICTIGRTFSPVQRNFDLLHAVDRVRQCGDRIRTVRLFRPR